MSWLRRMLDRFRQPPAAISRERQQTLDRADALLADPQIKALVKAHRRDQMRASFTRAGGRLGGR